MPTRRELLKRAVLGGASMFLPLPQLREPLAPSPHLVARKPSTVALVRPSVYVRFADAVRAAVTLAGGLGFIRPGQRVALKPAVNSTRPYPATTAPELVLAVANLVLEAGGEPFVADRTMFLRSTAEAFARTGIRDAAAQAKIACLALEDEDTEIYENAFAGFWGGEVKLYRPALAADHLINLCTPRTHRIGDFTMAMKNNVGLVAGSSRAGMHAAHVREKIAELSLFVRPSLIVLDGRQGFAAGGPDSGDLVRPDFLAAGSDPVAIDAVGIAELRLAGTHERLAEGSLWQLPTMRRALELGLGATSGHQIQLLGLSPAEEALLRAKLV